MARVRRSVVIRERRLASDMRRSYGIFPRQRANINIETQRPSTEALNHTEGVKYSSSRRLEMDEHAANLLLDLDRRWGQRRQRGYHIPPCVIENSGQSIICRLPR